VSAGGQKPLVATAVKSNTNPEAKTLQTLIVNPEEINIFSKAFLTEIASDTKLQKITKKAQ